MLPGEQARLVLTDRRVCDGLYCDGIVRRWRQMSGGEAVLEETGETFATLEGQRLCEGEV